MDALVGAAKAERQGRLRFLPSAFRRRRKTCRCQDTRVSALAKNPETDAVYSDEELYKPDWKAWFGDEGGERDGGPGDPRLALVLVEAHSVEYLVTTAPRPVVLFEVAKAIITGTPPKVGEQRTLNERELHTPAAREAR